MAKDSTKKMTIVKNTPKSLDKMAPSQAQKDNPSLLLFGLYPKGLTTHNISKALF